MRTIPHGWAIQAITKGISQSPRRTSHPHILATDQRHLISRVLPHRQLLPGRTPRVTASHRRFAPRIAVPVSKAKPGRRNEDGGPETGAAGSRPPSCSAPALKPPNPAPRRPDLSGQPRSAPVIAALPPARIVQEHVKNKPRRILAKWETWAILNFQMGHMDY